MPDCRLPEQRPGYAVIRRDTPGRLLLFLLEWQRVGLQDAGQDLLTGHRRTYGGWRPKPTPPSPSQHAGSFTATKPHHPSPHVQCAPLPGIQNKGLQGRTVDVHVASGLSSDKSGADSTGDNHSLEALEDGLVQHWP